MARALLLLLIPASGLAIAVGCSLGLDPTLIPGVASDGGPDAPSSVDAPTDTPADHVTVLPDGGACATDNDCKSTAACVTGAKCDTAQHVCVLDICGTAGACKSAVCDPTQTCTVPASYGFHASSFKVNQGIGCGGTASRCFAVVHPYAFVGTSSGVLAYQIGDPANGSPAQVPITGVSFVPLRIVSVDRRVYFLGAPPSGGAGKLQIAWLDVPGSPFLASLSATSALVSSPQTNMNLVVPTDKSSLFLVHVDSSKSFPTSIVTAPVTDSTTLTQFQSPGFPSNSTMVASSGPRLVTYRWDGSSTFQSFFSFETAAGTGNAQNGGEQTAAQMGPVWGAPSDVTFAQGPDGSVLWMAPTASLPDGGPQTIATARMAWVVNAAAATSFDETARVDVESYGSVFGPGTPVAGPMAWIDPQTVLVLAADHANTAGTSVQVASRAALPATLVANRHFVISAGVGQVSAVGAKGFGYVLAADDPQNQSATVHIFAPSCN